MRFTVTTLHNISEDMFFRFSPKTSRLFHAHDFQVEADSVEQAANLVWNLANVDSGDDLRQHFPHLSIYASQVDEYRRRRNRSLSMSDVLVFIEHAHGWPGPGSSRACGALSIEAVGHKSITPPEFKPGSNETLTSQAYEASRLFYESHNARRN